MKNSIRIIVSGGILAALAIATACSGPDESETTPTPSEPTGSGEGSVQHQPPGASSYFSIDEVGLGPDGYVALTNFTDVSVTLAGLTLCQPPDCFDLPDVVVPPGETARVTVGDGKELAGVVVTGATLGELKPADGEVALYSSREFDKPEAMLAYLQWGSTPHAATSVAVDAGLWQDTGYAPTGDNATRLYRVEESGLWLFDTQ